MKKCKKRKECEKYHHYGIKPWGLLCWLCGKKVVWDK